MNRLALTLLAGVAAVSFISSAQAADLFVSEPAPPVVVIDYGNNWDGAFIGAFAGYGWGSVTDEDGYFSLPDTDADLTGWQVGVSAGYNFTFSEALVAGVVGDIAWSDLSGDVADDGSSFDADWTGSIRGRLGFDGGAFLPYLTAGVAFANGTLTDVTNSLEDSQTHIGWTFGAGVEYALADNISLDLLYRFTDYGSQDYDLSPDTVSTNVTTSVITAGLNFSF